MERNGNKCFPVLLFLCKKGGTLRQRQLAGQACVKNIGITKILKKKDRKQKEFYSIVTAQGTLAAMHTYAHMFATEGVGFTGVSLLYYMNVILERIINSVSFFILKLFMQILKALPLYFICSIPFAFCSFITRNALNGNLLDFYFMFFNTLYFFIRQYKQKLS